jgi:hypothetical protein
MPMAQALPAPRVFLTPQKAEVLVYESCDNPACCFSPLGSLLQVWQHAAPPPVADGLAAFWVAQTFPLPCPGLALCSWFSRAQFFALSGWITQQPDILLFVLAGPACNTLHHTDMWWRRLATPCFVQRFLGASVVFRMSRF